MVVSKERLIEWEPQIRDVAQERILESTEKRLDVVQEKQEIQKSFLKKLKEVMKNKEGVVYAVIMNILILVGSIAAISLFIVIGGALMDPFLILSILLVILLFTVMEVFKLVEKETRCKNSH